MILQSILLLLLRDHAPVLCASRSIERLSSCLIASIYAWSCFPESDDPSLFLAARGISFLSPRILNVLGHTLSFTAGESATDFLTVRGESFADILLCCFIKEGEKKSLFLHRKKTFLRMSKKNFFRDEKKNFRKKTFL
jgi:hypothetical protein